MLRALSVAPLGTRTSLGSGMARGVGAARRRRGRVRRRAVSVVSGARRIVYFVVRIDVGMYVWFEGEGSRVCGQG